MLSGNAHEGISSALGILNENIGLFWYEAAESIPALELLASNLEFQQYQLASLILSKLFFYLSQFELSIKYALHADSLFDIENDQSVFTQTIISKIIDKYISIRHDIDSDSEVTIENKLEKLFNRIIKSSIEKGDLEGSIALCLETRRSDLSNGIIQSASSELLHYTMELVEIIDFGVHSNFKAEVLREIAARELQMSHPDIELVFRCYLDDNHLSELIDFISNVSSKEFLRGSQLAVDCSGRGCPTIKEAITDSADFSYKFDERLYVPLRLQFLANRNGSDMLILERSKSFLTPTSSLHHQALCFSNALMQAGTTCDELLRNDMAWFGQASNWSKFSAVSSLGVIHQGQENAYDLMEAFLPKDGVTSSEYAEGGALYALGLINPMMSSSSFSEDDGLLCILRKNLNNASGSEIVQHGACLGLGLSLLGRGASEDIEAIKTVLYSDSANSGEAAAIALGLLLYGSPDEALMEELLQYSKETQHEKISRAICIGIALMYSETGKGLEHNSTILEMINDSNDSIQRYGGIWALSLSFAKTGNRSAMEILLKSAVTDSSDDVRRSAVIGLGFVLYQDREELPELLRFLLQSYNPHVRYGAVMALGVCYAGSGDKKILELLKPLSRDLTDFVRQGTLMAMSMILQQQPESATKELRKALEVSVQTKHEDALVKFAALLSQGILDAGGRNTVFTLRNTCGKKPVAGMALFLQYWYWYPMIHMASLALVPTVFLTVAFDAEGKMMSLPVIQGIMSCPPSFTAYPKPLKPFESSATAKVLATAVLSTSKSKKKRGTGAEPEAEKVEEEEKKEEVEMPVEEPEFHVLSNFSRVPLWLADKFSCPLLSRQFDPFAINVVTPTSEVIAFEVLDSHTKPITSFNPKSTESKKITPPKPFKFNPNQ